MGESVAGNWSDRLELRSGTPKRVGSRQVGGKEDGPGSSFLLWHGASYHGRALAGRKFGPLGWESDGPGQQGAGARRLILLHYGAVPR